eukprot:m.19299 g.19299  ORF g.19299 m.19299 type:complete len:52 (-) comp11759_c0_seq1:38-193(-)
MTVFTSKLALCDGELVTRVFDQPFARVIALAAVFWVEHLAWLHPPAPAIVA